MCKTKSGNKIDVKKKIIKILREDEQHTKNGRIFFFWKKRNNDGKILWPKKQKISSKDTNHMAFKKKKRNKDSLKESRIPLCRGHHSDKKRESWNYQAGKIQKYSLSNL